MTTRRLLALLPLAALTACNPRDEPVLTSIAQVPYDAGEAGKRDNGSVGAPNRAPPGPDQSGANSKHLSPAVIGGRERALATSR